MGPRKPPTRRQSATNLRSSNEEWRRFFAGKTRKRPGDGSSLQRETTNLRGRPRQVGRAVFAGKTRLAPTVERLSDSWDPRSRREMSSNLKQSLFSLPSDHQPQLTDSSDALFGSPLVWPQKKVRNKVSQLSIISLKDMQCT